MLSNYYNAANSFTYNGVNSLDMGLFIIEQSGADNAAEPVIETINVPARGNFVVDNRIDELDNQQFNDYVRKYVCCVDIDAFKLDLEEHARRLYAWLYGSGIEYKKLYDTYDRDYYTLAYVNSGASVSELAKRLLGQIEIQFRCKAYKRALKGDETITITKAATIINPEGFTATPYMKIYGSGNVTLYINNRAHGFKNIDGYIEVDSENMNAYKGDTLQNNKMLVGAFPKLAAGDNNISWAGNVTKIEIVPRWCKL
nr:MAG TPA: distal tail protein [Caudoviricetes sp.]